MGCGTAKAYFKPLQAMNPEKLYFTSLEQCQVCGAGAAVTCLLTYEVTPLRPGLNRWFMVSKETVPTQAANPPDSR